MQKEIHYPAYQIKAFGKVVEITEDRFQAHSAFDRCVSRHKELWHVQPNGSASILRSER